MIEVPRDNNPDDPAGGHQPTGGSSPETAAPPAEGYLEERARRGDRAQFERILAKVKDRAPDPGDELG
jgi:hypothetical protein